MRRNILLGVLICALPALSREAGAAPAGFPPISDILGPAEDPRDAAVPPPSLEGYREAMRSRDPLARLAAVRAFGYRGNVAAIPHISAALLRFDEEVPVRVAAAEALGRIADRRAWPFLSGSAADLDERVRFASVLALGRIDAEGSAAILEKTLRKDPSWWVRYAAAMSLGGLRKNFVADWLERTACEDSAWQVRFQAAVALGDLGQRAVLPLAKPLRDPDVTVRTAAALALARIGGAKSAFILGRALQFEEDGGVRAVLDMALRKVRVRL